MKTLQEEIMLTLYRVWRKRWWAVLVAWVGCLLGWAFVATIPNTYSSDARILVDTGSVLQREMGVQSGGESLNIIRQTLTSRLNLEKVLRRTELDLRLENDEQVDQAIETLATNISIQRQTGNLFSIGYSSSDPSLTDAENAALARNVVDNLLQIFMEENVTADRDDINEAIRFFEDQLAQRERELEAAEQRRSEFELKYLGRLQGTGNLGERLRDAQSQLFGLETELAEAQRSLGALQSQIRSTPATLNRGVSSSSYNTPAASRAAALEQSISDMYAQGKLDSHPDIVLAKRQLERLQAQAADEAAELAAQGYDSTPPSSNPVYVALRNKVFDGQARVAGLAARRDRLKGDIEKLQQNLDSSPGIAVEQAKLNRDYGVLKAQYEALLQSREEIRLQSDVQTQTQQVRFSVVDPPSQPREPTAPNRPLFLTVVFVAAAGAGLGIAFLLGQLRGGFIVASQLENIYELPVLGTVSEIVTDEDRSRNRIRLAGLMVLSFGLVAIWGALVLYELV